ncbi:Hypothetical protein A7982_01075 [Minicystis rosea]|nr:Hypothetical protein A7982_01075 [Minicystis rosea]
MSEALAPRSTPSAPTHAKPLLGLLLAPALTALGVAVAPRLTLSEPTAAAAVFAGAATAGLLALAASARAFLAPRAAIILAVAGLCVLAVAFFVAPPPAVGVILVNLGLVSIAHAAGASIGRRVAHPGHLLPACAVAAAADVVSLIHPSGPTHAIASSPRALAFFALGFPVPGTRLVAPALGFGDLVFLALVLGVAATHAMSLTRTAICGALGLAVAGVVAGALDINVPALVPIGAAVVIGLPEARRLRAEDRRTAQISMAAAVAVVISVLLSPR